MSEGWPFPEKEVKSARQYPRLGTEIPHVWDVDGKARGVVHELIQEGTELVVRESWTENGKPYHSDQIRLPFDQAVHILLNLTSAERERFGTERTVRPTNPETDGA